MPEERLLIVDDEAAIRLPLERFFTNSGFEVITAATQAERSKRTGHGLRTSCC